MNMSKEIALTAQIDQLRTALREALRLMDSRGLGVTCETCGARVSCSCFGDAPMSEPHEARILQTNEELRQILATALGRKESQA
ncbi:hypothetical protein ACFW2V_13030 [Streptomyces sp. NPDC058947]|uniref:hypothetical protein n=1 Tax=Streptomyces sp. NPDC058947 TaxID=3346675 RepID=UPI0036C1B4CD